MTKITREDALEYHRLKGRPGKIQVVPTKPNATGTAIRRLALSSLSAVVAVAVLGQVTEGFTIGVARP